jgi:mono/diheme cytochrome c family protein
MRHIPQLIIAVAVVLTGYFIDGCKKDETNATPPPAPAQQAAPVTTTPPPSTEPLTAESVFKTRCSTCHGETGHGDGPASAALNPKPRNYTDPEWQKSVTDEQLKKTIVGGGVAVGKSPLMVPNPDLADKPEVVEGLVKIIRAFAPKT